MLPMLQECQLNNPEIEFGQIQDSLLVSPKQHGRLEHEQFLH